MGRPSGVVWVSGVPGMRVSWSKAACESSRRGGDAEVGEGFGADLLVEVARGDDEDGRPGPDALRHGLRG